MFEVSPQIHSLVVASKEIKEFLLKNPEHAGKVIQEQIEYFDHAVALASRAAQNITFLLSNDD